MATPAKEPSGKRRRWLRIGAGVAVVALAFLVVLPRLADYGDVWDEVSDLSLSSVVLLIAITATNLATFAPPLMIVLPGVGFVRAFAATQASTASTYVAPGGAAVGMAFAFVLLRRWGYRASAIGLGIAVMGVWNQLVQLGFPAVALALLTNTGGQNPLLRTVALVGLAVFVSAVTLFTLALASKRAARWAGGVVVRAAHFVASVIRRDAIRWDAERVVRFRSEALVLLRRRWHALTLATLAGQLTVFALLLASLRAVGVSPDEVTWIEAFAAWSLIRLLGAIPLTPGGIGVVEVGLTALLVGFGGDDASVVAAVLIYRFLTLVPTLVLGLGAGAL